MRSSSVDVPLVSCSWASTELDAQELRQQFAMVRRVAQEELRTLGALEVEVRVVLPREADAAVDLDVLRRAVEVGLGAERLGEAGRDRQLVVQLLGGPGGVVGGRLGALH